MAMKSVRLLSFVFSLAFLDLTAHKVQFLKGNQASESSEKKDWSSSGQIRTHDPPSSRLDALATEQLLEVNSQQGDILIHHTPAIPFLSF